MPHRARTATLFGIVLTVGLTGCSASPPASPAVTVTVAPAPSATAAPAVAVVTAPADATAVAKRIAEQIRTVTKIVRITEDNDPNDLLGRSNGYTSASVVKDSRVRCSDGLGADCGATVEGWRTVADARARRDYIVGILKSAPALGSEYDTVHGRFLLRVAGGLKPSQAKRYSHAFAAAFGS